MLNRSSKVPLYHQLYELLRSQIMLGELKPGDMLPPENTLLARYGVSRNTVRQALDALVNDGLIQRERGRGTFVRQPPIEQGLSRIISFTEDMRQRGLSPHTQILASDLIPAPEAIAQQLDVPAGEPLAYLERLRLADNEPMSIEHSFLVHRYCPGILNQDYASVPLREELEKRYGLSLVYAKQTIRAISALPEMAQKLGVRIGAALLYIERVSYDQHHRPVEYLRIYHRGDRYALYTELRDQPGSGQLKSPG